MRCGVVSLLVIVLGCATAPVSRTDVAGAAAWRVAAFQGVPTTVHGPPGEC
jgi:hypothetical protein